MKICTGCGKNKPASDFQRDYRKVDGTRACCKVCILEKRRHRYHTDEAYKNSFRDYRQSKSEHLRTLCRLWGKENLAYVREKKRERYQNNAKFRASVNASKALYRAAKLSSQPACLSDSDKQKIKDIYLLVGDLQLISGQKYHVDHIIPLRGKGVCGLHVPWNLQVLPADINLSKGNTYENSW
jgi:hypothetical protein